MENANFLLSEVEYKTYVNVYNLSSEAHEICLTKIIKLSFLSFDDKKIHKKY